jgi:hypothetical protein
MELGGSLPHSHELSTCLYTEQYHPVHTTPTYLSIILSTHLRFGFASGLFPSSIYFFQKMLWCAKKYNAIHFIHYLIIQVFRGMPHILDGLDRLDGQNAGSVVKENVMIRSKLVDVISDLISGTY